MRGIHTQPLLHLVEGIPRAVPKSHGNHALAQMFLQIGHDAVHGQVVAIQMGDDHGSGKTQVSGEVPHMNGMKGKP